ARRRRSGGRGRSRWSVWSCGAHVNAFVDMMKAIMKTLFDAADRESLVARLNALQSTSVRQWGKMEPAQMLCHCAIALETATGDRPMKQAFLGKLLTPLIRSSVLGEKPF